MIIQTRNAASRPWRLSLRLTETSCNRALVIFACRVGRFGLSEMLSHGILWPGMYTNCCDRFLRVRKDPEVVHGL